jgi:hypothetical protein
LSIQEIINDLYIVSLTSGNISGKKSSVIATLKDIISRLNAMFLNGTDETIPDDLTGRLTITEGHQESLIAECNVLEAAYDEIVSNCQETIVSEGKKEIFDTFPQIARLMSSSVFAELTDSSVSVPVTAESLSKAKETMLSEYAELFKKNTKLVNRAVMAASLNKMPVVFNTAQDLTDYIQQSLLQCRDENERQAAMNILDSIMLES